MKFSNQLLPAFTLALLTSCAAAAQTQASEPYGLEPGQAPSMQFAVQYQATHANAPPGSCGCFWLQGGGGQFTFTFHPRLGATIDITHSSASALNGTDENLRLTNFTAGPRYSLWRTGHWTPYGQALVGISHVSSNYVLYGSGRNYFAGQLGLGLNYHLKPHFSLIPVEVDYIYSQAPNNVNSRQNNIRLGAGLVYRLGVH